MRGSPTPSAAQTPGPAPARVPGPGAIERAEAGLTARFGRAPAGYVFAPYRVCPLGAHVDHQDGAVTGMAIDRGVAVAYAPREDARVRAASADFPGEVAFELGDVPPAVPGEWGNFLRGAALVLQTAPQDAPPIPDAPQTPGGPVGRAPARGVDLFVAGELPIGGLSSSAAVAVGYLMALTAAAGDPDLPAAVCATLVHRVENEYVGLRSGLLDQSMILFAREDRLLHLDCRTGEREYVPCGAPQPAVLVAYSGLGQALVGTGYNQRVAECREAADRLLRLAGLPLPAGGARLRDVPAAVYERHRGALPTPLARRAAHYFGEQARVAAGRAAWRDGDLVTFGRLVAESGRSSIENYECGAPELVALYEALLEAPGVYGARFSGAGFRGACLALVDPPAFDAAAGAVRARYLRAYPPYEATFGVFRCAPGPAARRSPAAPLPAGPKSEVPSRSPLVSPATPGAPSPET
jgi:galacturonokinase